MDFWAWGGKYIGASYNDILFSSKGNPIGRFDGEVLYDFNGKYLGEIKSENRLIVNNSRTHLISHVSARPINRAMHCYADYAGYAMYAGYSDFIWKD